MEPEQVQRILRGLKVNKATGPGGLSNRLLKLAAPAIAKTLATIYNGSLENGVVPGEWKIANVSPIFKAETKL